MAMDNLKQYVASLCAAVVFGVVSIIFVVIWMTDFRGGVAWDGGPAEFNWHPILTVVGFIFLQGMATIVYRLPFTWRCPKLVMKLIHAGLHIIAFIFAIVSMVAVFDFHNSLEIPNMYSLHSWLGLIAVVLYSLQIVLGVIMFLIPVTPVSWRAAFMPVHIYSGILLLISVIAVALMGITEKLLFAVSYSASPPEAIFVNFLGLFLVIFGALVIWIVTRPSWKRPSDQISHSLHTNDGEGKTEIGPALSQLTDEPDYEACGDIRRRSNKLDEQPE